MTLYERGLQALQRRAFSEAAELLRQLLDRYPEEKELHERVRLYLRVCERETGPPPPAPRSFEERLYAATLALNAGRPEEALPHLETAATERPDHDHVHYMLAVAYAVRREVDQAVAHLRRAIDLNPENRVLARQEPDFDPIRGAPEFRALVEPRALPPLPKRRVRSRIRP